MLHFESIEPGTLDLLRRLMAEPVLAELYLVGGTALALHFGHRPSVDLDLLRDDGFETRTVAENLSAVSRRGSRKGFYDVAELLRHFPLPELLEWFGQKFGNFEPMMVIRSLVCFDDAESDGEVVLLSGVVWEEVKDQLSDAVAAL